MKTMPSDCASRIICADAITGLKKLPDDCVQCVVTSPPYWGLRDYGVDGMIGLEPTLDEFISNLVAVFREVRRVLHPSGVCWINMGNSYASSLSGSIKTSGKLEGGGFRTNKAMNTYGNGYKPKDLIPQAWLLGLALQQDGWWLRSEIIWHKPNPMPGSQVDRPTTGHETILMLTKSQKYAFYMDQVREPNNPDNRKVTKVVGKEGSIQHRDGERWPNPGGRALRSVWTFATEPMGWQMCAACKTVYAPDEYRRLPTKDKTRTYEGDGQGVPSGWATGSKSRLNGTDELEGGFTGIQKQCRTCKATDQWLSHFAAFPKELAKRCILASTKPNDVVLDPFAGACTTGLVARNLGRDYVLIELNPDYVILGETRLKRETQQVVMAWTKMGAARCLE